MTERKHFDALADRVLAGKPPTRNECLSVLGSPETALLSLLDAAFKIRHRHFGFGVQLHVLKNAKSGLCPEDCHYCSQSSVSDAPIEKYPLQSQDNILAGAVTAHAGGAHRYCIVTSGRAPTESEVDRLCGTVRAIKDRMDIEICCCLGLLTADHTRRLRDAGVDRVNHNLNTSESHHDQIVSTHTYKDRLETLRHVRDAGLDICSGGIVGMGESHDDIIDLAFELNEAGADSIPVNFLHPISGTPLEGREDLTPRDCLRTLCLFRFINPDREIRVAGGRERNIRSLQPLALYPANSIFMEGYLTTNGQATSDAHQMISDAGFEVTTGQSFDIEPAISVA
ncbi:biotin synthase BioB [bacterium]|jgi:biotin synthase|nr:biotin synthase BioB [Gemmatimonadota bacterium]MCH2663596.1 biotin synthase BioB [bacterium]